MLPENFSVQKTQNNSNNIEDTLTLSQKNSLLSRDAFLKLFIEQLKNQDPLNPMKNYEVSAQLAQFSSLEQLFNINKDFQKFIEVSKKAAYFQGVALLGKTVKYQGDTIFKSKDGSPTIEFKLHDKAIEANINIYDQKGNFVRTLKLDKLTKGENSVKWDGKDYKGNEVPEGIYKYEVVAYDYKGNPVDYTPFGNGIITNIRYDDVEKEALFKINNDEVSLDRIISITN